MFQETKNTFNPADTAKNAKSSQKNVFGVFKGGKKNEKSKCQLEGCNNKCSKKKFKRFCSDKCYLSNLADECLEEGESNFSKLTKIPTTTSSTSVSSTTLPLPTVTVTRPVASTSVTSFFDDDSSDPELTAGSSSKSLSLSNHWPWNNGSGLRLEVPTNDDELNDSSSNGQGNLEGSTGKKKKSSRKFKSIRKLRFFNHHPINSEQNDSAYETATEKDSQKKEKRQKKIKKTILTPLSSEDEEYIEIKKKFVIGIPKGNILGISRLQMPTKLVNSHEQYKKQTGGVSYRMFHGTRSACNPQRLVGLKHPGFCKSGCGVCGVAKEGNKSKFSRYGNKMWFAESSATSKNYCQNNYNGGVAVKVMFVVEVVATSYESILIVDKDAATIPKYFIVYT